MALEPRPLYVLFCLAISICAFFFFIGTVCVRLWFYKGALGPEPEKFIIFSKNAKVKAQEPVPDIEKQPNNNNRRMTVFPQLDAPKAANTTDTSLNSTFDPTHFSTLPTINIRDVDTDHLDEEFQDPSIRAQVAEEIRISRLPAFVQDDCGDGSEFPDIPIVLDPIEDTTASTSQSTHPTDTLLTLNLQNVSRTQWLHIDATYIEQHAARATLLTQKRADCVQIKPEGEDACDELLEEVVEFLVANYPSHFSIRNKKGRRHVRNELTQEEYALVRPYDRHPLEVCARLAMEDFQVLGRGEFTRQWYLQASATLFPAGWNMRAHIGKSLDLITNNPNEPMPLWEDLPTILSLPSLSPYTFAPDLLTSTSLFIQTSPTPYISYPSLFAPRPADLFAGNISHLSPSNLLLRTETHTFRLLPRSGAVVLSTRTHVRKLEKLEQNERWNLLDRVEAWGEAEARFKGRGLWITGVEGWCLGKGVWRDDCTVFSGEG